MTTYTTNDWRGNPHFECNQCAFDTFDEREIVRHIQDYHNPPPAKPARKPTTTQVFAPEPVETAQETN